MLTGIIGRDCGLPNAPGHRLPCSTHADFLAIIAKVSACQHHAALARIAFDGQQPAAIRHPSLVPELSTDIVRRETLADGAGRIFIAFAQRAAVENPINLHVCRALVRIAINHIPVAEPKVELMIFR